ncbi:MAG: hypothetical protein OEP95_13550 [Myxococcales bacterium]|nr:hypothetical protein [Myxococcales bacterium]
MGPPPRGVAHQEIPLTPHRFAIAEASLRTPADVPAPVPLEILQTAHCRVADFPDGAAFARGDELAAFVAPLTDGLRGVAMIGMEPEAILRVLAPLAGSDVPEAWSELAAGLLRAIAARLGDAACGPGRLHEGSIVEAVVETHAPPDITVLSAQATIAGEPAGICVLLDPKELGGDPNELG